MCSQYWVDANSINVRRIQQMSKHQRIFIKLLLPLSILAISISSCGSDDKPVAPTPVPVDMLQSQFVASAPADNATVDALWSTVPALSIATTVPSYTALDGSGNDIWWDSYEGNTSLLTLKSVYDANYIYILAQWDDAEDSRRRQAWYYHQDANPANSKWLQMGKFFPDEFGNDPAYEDKFTVFWNMTVPSMGSLGCGPFCHGTHMSTNASDEKLDIWHWKRCRTAPVFQLDDKWMDDGATSGGNGRHSDAGTGAYADNKYTINTANTGNVDMTVPEYWIPGRSNYDWISAAEIAAGTARKIVDVDANGNLVDEDATVLNRTLFGYGTALVIPSLKEIKAATGSRGDVSAWHNWSGGQWTLKIKRLRNTGNTDDVQFTQTSNDYWFSVGIMNAAAIAHSTPGGWTASAYRLSLKP